MGFLADLARELACYNTTEELPPGGVLSPDENDIPCEPIKKDPEPVKVFTKRPTAVFAGLLAHHEFLKQYSRALFLWNWIRMKDNECNEGSGFYEFQIAEAAAVFGKSERTILRWLKKGKQKNLFRSVLSKPDGTRRVYYSSVAKIVANSGVDIAELSAIYIGNTHDLQGIEEECVQAVTQLYQRRSWYAALQDYKSNKKKMLATGHRRRIAKPRDSDYVLPTLKKRDALSKQEEPDASVCNWVRKLPSGTSLQRQYMDERFTYVGEHFTCYGVSQERLGAELKCHRVTISRLLSNRQRRKQGLKPLIRRQVVQECPELVPLVLAKVEIPPNFFVSNKKVWERKTNVYQELLELIRLKSVRKKVKALLEKLKPKKVQKEAPS